MVVVGGRHVRMPPGENERRVREQSRALPGHPGLCEHAMIRGWLPVGLMRPGWKSLVTTYRWPMVSSKDGEEEGHRLGKSSRLRGISIEPDRAAYAFERFAKAGQVRAFPASIGFRPTRRAC
jgi:hypothetical protein